jgi:hypothetical protein
LFGGRNYGLYGGTEKYGNRIVVWPMPVRRMALTVIGLAFRRSKMSSIFDEL